MEVYQTNHLYLAAYLVAVKVELLGVFPSGDREDHFVFHFHKSSFLDDLIRAYYMRSDDSKVPALEFVHAYQDLYDRIKGHRKS